MEVPEEQKPEGGNGGGTGKAGAERRQWGGTGRAGAERRQWERNRKSRSRKAAMGEEPEKQEPKGGNQDGEIRKSRTPAADSGDGFP